MFVPASPCVVIISFQLNIKETVQYYSYTSRVPSWKTWVQHTPMARSRTGENETIHINFAEVSRVCETNIRNKVILWTSHELMNNEEHI